MQTEDNSETGLRWSRGQKKLCHMPKKGEKKDTEILNRKDDVFIVLWQSTNDGRSECHQQQQTEFSQ